MRLEFHTELCTEALDKELGTLRSQGVWDEDGVREWRSVRSRSGADGKDELVGKLFAIMVEKNAEGGVLPHLRKYKARIVFAGNNIQTASGTQAHELFQELPQTPAAMRSVRAALGIAALQEHTPKVRDATQADIQARIDGPDRPRTWVRLPRQWWPAAWFDASGKPLYGDPVVPLVRALHGHPESGALLNAHLEAIPGHALHEKGLQIQIGVGTLVGNQEQRALLTPLINRGSTGHFVPPSVYIGIRLSVLLGRR